METSGLIWLNFKLIQALMYVIITCKYEKDPIKNNQEKNAVFQFISLQCICCRGNQWLDLAEFRTHPSFYTCPHCFQVCKGSDEKKRRKCDDVIFSIIGVWGFFQTLKGSQLLSPWSDLAKFGTQSSSYVYHHYVQV